jgi:hypothetical protein
MRLLSSFVSSLPVYLSPFDGVSLEISFRGFGLSEIENLSAIKIKENQGENGDWNLLKSAGCELIQVMDFSDNCLRKLENFPYMPELHTLFAHSNIIHSISPRLSDYLPSLEYLALNGNAFDSLSSLSCFSQFSSLKLLSLQGNPITSHQLYRPAVIYLTAAKTKLQVLDWMKIGKNEIEQAMELFKSEENRMLIEGNEEKKSEKATNRSSNPSVDQATSSSLSLLSQLESAQSPEELQAIEQKIKASLLKK